jgi:hypothetical protein
MAGRGRRGLVFGFEETLETSIVVWALKQEAELEARPRSAGAAPR